MFGINIIHTSLSVSESAHVLVIQVLEFFATSLDIGTDGSDTDCRELVLDSRLARLLNITSRCCSADSSRHLQFNRTYLKHL